jgi:hypothetical protein
MDARCVGAAIYSRASKFNGFQINVVNSKAVRVRTPDRELLFVTDFYLNSHIHEKEHWDEILVLSPYGNTNKDTHIKFFMNNYFADSDKVKGLPPIKFLEMDTCVLGDSGGFQIARGSAGLIDPADIAGWYTHHVHIGMTLDIPLSGYEDAGVVKRAAQVQAHNTKVMLEVFKSSNASTQLFNIAQGSSFELKERHHEIVYNNKVDRIATSNFGVGDVFNVITLITRIIDEWGYKHLHLLGLYNPVLMLSLGRHFSLNHPKKLITMDSTNGFRQGMSGVRYQAYGMDKFPSLIDTTYRGGWKSSLKQAQNDTLSCGCKVCSTMKYGILFDKTQFFNPFGIWHNNYELVRNHEIIKDASESLDDDQYEDFVKSRLPKDVKIKDVLRALSFVKDIKHSGLTYAQKRHSQFFHGQSGMSSPVSTLFDDSEPNYDGTPYLEFIVEKYETFIKEKATDKLKKEVLKGKQAKPLLITSKLKRK